MDAKLTAINKRINAALANGQALIDSGRLTPKSIDKLDSVCELLQDAFDDYCAANAPHRKRAAQKVRAKRATRSIDPCQAEEDTLALITIEEDILATALLIKQLEKMIASMSLSMCRLSG